MEVGRGEGYGLESTVLTLFCSACIQHQAPLRATGAISVSSDQAKSAILFVGAKLTLYKDHKKNATRNKPVLHRNRTETYYSPQALRSKVLMNTTCTKIQLRLPMIRTRTMTKLHDYLTLTRELKTLKDF